MATGIVKTYDLTTGLYLNIEPLIAILSPFDVPLQGGQGADGRSALSTDTCFEKKVEWQDETLLTPLSTAAATATTGQTYILVAAGDQIRFSTGDIVLVGAEYMRVTGYGTTTDTLTVTRAYAGSAATVATSVMIGLFVEAPPRMPMPVEDSSLRALAKMFVPVATRVWALMIVPAAV